MSTPGGRADRAARPGSIDPEVDRAPDQGPDRRPRRRDPHPRRRDQRVLVTTLTKKMAEDLTEYLLELGMRVRYLHSEVDTLERVEILRGLRLGDFDVLVGINLLREGLDLPEVSLVAILDADKEGFLRSRDVADPDHRPRRPQRRRPGDHVRRPDDRLDAPARSRETNRRRKEQLEYNARARDRPADGAQEGHRHPRDAARLRRRRDRRSRGAAGAGGGAVSRSGRRCSTSPTCRPTTSAASSRRCRTRCRRRHEPAVRGGGPPARRDHRAQAGAAAPPSDRRA